MINCFLCIINHPDGRVKTSSSDLRILEALQPVQLFGEDFCFPDGNAYNFVVGGTIILNTIKRITSKTSGEHDISSSLCTCFQCFFP